MTPDSASQGERVRFGVFDVDLVQRRLRKHGLRVRLQDQPFRILALLLAKPGQVVSREEIQKELWPSDTFVEFEPSLNAAVKRLRAALGDSADAPRYVETVPKQGYRFIAPIHRAEAIADTQFPDVRGRSRTKEGLGGTRRYYWLAGIALILILFALGTTVALRMGQNGVALSARIYSVETDQAPLAPSVSPDGQYIAYFAVEESETQYSLYIRNLQETRSRRIGVFPIPYLHQPVWSPDGKFVAAILRSRTLFKVAVSGGEPTPVIQIPEQVAWQSKLIWSPRARIFISGWEVDEGVGKLVPAISATDGGARRCIDAAAVSGQDLFYCGSMVPTNLIELIDSRARLIRSYDLGQAPLFSPSGHLLFSSAESLWALPVRGKTQEPSGAPVRIARDASYASLTTDGTLVFLESTGLRQQLVWKDRTGEDIETVGPSQWRITQPSLERNSGRILTRARNEPSDEWSFWLYDPTRGLSTLEVIGPDVLDRPRWAPGGDEFTYSVFGVPHIQRVQSPATKGSVLFKIDGGSAWIRDWCPQSDCLMFTKTAGGSVDMWIMTDPLKDSRTAKQFLATSLDETSPVISPDGKFVAYQARRPEVYGVYVNTFPVPTREIPISTNAAQPAWSADGRELYFVEDGRYMMAAPVSTESGFEVVGPIVALFEHRGLGVSRGQEYDVSADGTRFLVVKTLQEPRNVIRVVKQWRGLLN